MRIGKISRRTRETEISLEINLDGSGNFQGSTSVFFLDHMLSLLCRHGGLDLTLKAAGDLEVDNHHLVEDVGICIGLALKKAWGDKEGIRRYGSALIPMDEALILAAMDLSGRPFLSYKVQIPDNRLGSLETELLEEFWRAVTFNGLFTLHLIMLDGKNSHHIAEALFKAAGVSLKKALSSDPRMKGIPSTKGKL